MEKPFQIRGIIESDDAALAPIIRGSLEEFKANKPGTVYFDKATDHLSQGFQIKSAAYFVVEENGEVAGGGGYYPTEGLDQYTCELVKMYLGSSYRRKGYGQLLLTKCMEGAKLYGYKNMYIETLPELTNAIELYKKNGFRFLKSPRGNSGHTGCDIWMLRTL